MASRPLRNAKTDVRLAAKKRAGVPVGSEGGSSSTNPKTRVSTDTRTKAIRGAIVKTVEKSRPNKQGGDDFISRTEKVVKKYKRPSSTPTLKGK